MHVTLQWRFYGMWMSTMTRWPVTKIADLYSMTPSSSHELQSQAFWASGLLKWSEIHYQVQQRRTAFSTDLAIQMKGCQRWSQQHKLQALDCSLYSMGSLWCLDLLQPYVPCTLEMPTPTSICFGLYSSSMNAQDARVMRTSALQPLCVSSQYTLAGASATRWTPSHSL